MRRGDGVAPVSITIRIDEKLAGLTPNDPECCIFRVHTQLRKVNEKAYEPQLLAIGPYHRAKDDLRLMEEHKLRYLQLLLRRRNESSVKTYIKAVKELEERARKFYAEPISLTSDEFVEMMLLDGFFIIELLRKVARKVSIDIYDQIFRLSWIFYNVRRDLVLFENQIPFFLLTKLFEMTKAPNQQDNLIDLAIFFFQDSFIGRISELSHESFENIGHLLALLHKSIIPSEEVVAVGNPWNLIPSATELQEAGVKLKKLEISGGSFFDIKFNNGVLEIPLLNIEDRSESIFRNLIAYEQYRHINHLRYFTAYVSFMDNLINSPKDVELLRRRGIIQHFLGDDEAVSTMFNKLCDCVIASDSYYEEILRNLNNHCGRRQNVWIAKLRHNYFNSPWALISFLAAAFLLLLALTQTIFSILSYTSTRK